jgi:hypothetical protein
MPRLIRALIAAGLAFGLPALAASAQAPAGVPEFKELSVDELGIMRIIWEYTGNAPAGPFGLHVNVYNHNGYIHDFATVPQPPDVFDRDMHVVDVPVSRFGHGTIDDTRFCIALQSYVGTGLPQSSIFSAESPRKCVGTQRVLEPIPSQGQCPFAACDPPSKPDVVVRPDNDILDVLGAPAGPTKPDLAVTRVTGPTEMLAGTEAVYEVVLWNEGAPAQGTAQALIGLLGVEPVQMVEIPDGFTCTLGNFGFSCLGSLGGVNDGLLTRGATFKVQVRGSTKGSAAVYASANHDRTLDEVTVDNNHMLVNVVVK